MHCYVFRIREVERGEENLNNNSTNQKVPADNSGIWEDGSTLSEGIAWWCFIPPSDSECLPWTRCSQGGLWQGGRRGRWQDPKPPVRSPPQADPLHAAGGYRSSQATAASASTRALVEEEPQKGGLVWSTVRFLWPTPSHSSDKRPRRETLSIYESKFYNWLIVIYFLSWQE